MKPITKARQAKIKSWLKARGHDKAKVDGKKLDTDADLRRAVCELHGLSEDDYLTVMR